jgi:hypothetical protein
VRGGDFVVGTWGRGRRGLVVRYGWVRCRGMSECCRWGGVSRCGRLGVRLGVGCFGLSVHVRSLALDHLIFTVQVRVGIALEEDIIRGVDLLFLIWC